MEVKVVRIRKRHKVLYVASVVFIVVLLQSLYSNYAPAYLKIGYFSITPVIAEHEEVLVMRSHSWRLYSGRVYGVDQLRGGFTSNPNDMFLITSFRQTGFWLVGTGISSSNWNFRVDGDPDRGLPNIYPWFQVRSTICLRPDFTNCITVNSKPFKATSQGVQ